MESVQAVCRVLGCTGVDWLVFPQAGFRGILEDSRNFGFLPERRHGEGSGQRMHPLTNPG